MLINDDTWGRGLRLARLCEVVPGSQLKIDSQLSWKYYVASETEEHGASA